MDRSTRHDRVTEVFLAASELAPGARSAYLDAACGDDDALRGEVEAMLVRDAAPLPLLQGSALGPEFKIMWRASGSDASEEAGVDEAIPWGEPPPGLHPPRIGRYRIIDVIGEGGVGIVYLAEQEKPTRRVVLKVLGPGSLSRRMLQRFEHEAEILGRLRHPGIAQIYEAGVANAGFGPQPFFAMEHVAGRSLTEYATARGLVLRDRLELFVRICEAVHHAHQKGVVHRDLKPAHILVDDGGHPKILDFGIARITDADVRTTTMHTERGQLLGTVPYMSPEQARGEVRDIDVRSDVFALGVIAYELCSGRLPHDLHGLMLHEAIQVILDREPPPLGTIDRSLRGDVETIVSKALAKLREHRYQSVTDLAGDVRRWLEYEPITAKRASTAHRLRRFIQRRRSVAVGTGIALLAVLIGLTTTTWQAISARRESLRAYRAEEQAQERFDQIRTLANTFIFDVHDEIAEVAGTTAARRSLMETALTYLDALATESVDDRALLSDLADGYVKVGHVLGNPHQSNLGDQEGALASYEKALAIRRVLLDEAPTSNEARLDVAHALRQTAIVLTVTGETASAWERHEEALVLVQAIVAMEPEHDRALREVLANKGVMGRLASKRGDTDGAMVLLRDAIRIGERLRAPAPDDPSLLVALRTSLNELASLQQWTGHTTEAMGNFRRAHGLAERLCDIAPENTRYRRALFTSRLGLGDVLGRTGRADEALVEYEMALAAVHETARRDAHDRRVQQDIGYACERIARLLLEQGDAEGALARFKEGRSARAAVVAVSPEDTEASYNLAISTLQVGAALAALGRRDEALLLFDEALARSEALRDNDPADYWYQHLIAGVIDETAKLRLEMGELDGALSSYLRMREVAQTLVEADPVMTENHLVLAMANIGVGSVYETQERHEDAVASFRESLRIHQTVAKKDPANVETLRSVAQDHERLGRLLGDGLQQSREAIIHYRRAIEVRGDVTPATAVEAEYTARLAADHVALGRHLLDLGELAAGVDAIDVGLEILDRIIRRELPEPRRRELVSRLERIDASGSPHDEATPRPALHRVRRLQTVCDAYAETIEQLNGPSPDTRRSLSHELAFCRRTLDAMRERLSNEAR